MKRILIVILTAFILLGSGTEPLPGEAVRLVPESTDIPLSVNLTVLGTPIKKGYALQDWELYGNNQILLLQRKGKAAYLSLYDLYKKTGTEVYLTDLQDYCQLSVLENVDGAQIGLQHSPNWTNDKVRYDLYSEDLRLVKSVDITYPTERYDSGAWVILQDGSGTAYIQSDPLVREGDNKGELWRADADGSNPRRVLNCKKAFGGGGIWWMETRGEYLCFDLTSNPYPGPWGQGILHLPSEKYYFHEGVDDPALLADGKMLIYGSHYMGRFGAQMSIYDFKTGTLTLCPYFEDNIFLRASDNARYLCGVGGEYSTRAITINAYDTEKKLLFAETIPLQEQYFNYFDEIEVCQISNDGKTMLYQFYDREDRIQIYHYRIDWSKARHA